MFLSIADDDDGIDYAKKWWTVRVRSTRTYRTYRSTYTVAEGGGYVRVFLSYRITRLSQSPPLPKTLVSNVVLRMSRLNAR